MRRLALAGLLLLTLAVPAAAINDQYGFPRDVRMVEVVGGTSQQFVMTTVSGINIYAQPLSPSWLGNGSRLRITFYLTVVNQTCNTGASNSSVNFNLLLNGVSIASPSIVAGIGDGSVTCLGAGGTLVAGRYEILIAPSNAVGSSPRSLLVAFSGPAAAGNTSLAAFTSNGFATSVATVTSVDFAQPNMLVLQTGASTLISSATIFNLLVERVPALPAAQSFGQGWTQP